MFSLDGDDLGSNRSAVYEYNRVYLMVYKNLAGLSYKAKKQRGARL